MLAPFSIGEEMPTYTMPFDELNNLRTFLSEIQPFLLSTEESERQAAEDALMEELWALYGTAYLNGVREANVQLEGSVEASADRFTEQALKVVAGKNFIDRVEEYAPAGDIEAIYRVADTDAHRLYVSGELDAAIENGASEKTWHTMEDWRVRETHDPLEGIKVGINDYFVTFDGDEAQMPGDFTLAENNVNCRCWLTFDY